MTAADPFTPLPPAKKRKPRRLSPALLGRVAAADFTSLSPSAWDRLNAAALCPAPVRLGGRLAWGRSELAAWVRHGCTARASWSKLWPQIRDRRK